MRWGKIQIRSFKQMYKIISSLAGLVSAVSVPLFGRWLLVCRVSASIGGPVVGLSVRWVSAV